MSLLFLWLFDLSVDCNEFYKFQMKCTMFINNHSNLSCPFPSCLLIKSIIQMPSSLLTTQSVYWVTDPRFPKIEFTQCTVTVGNKWNTLGMTFLHKNQNLKFLMSSALPLLKRLLWLSTDGNWSFTTFCLLTGSSLRGVERGSLAGGTGLICKQDKKTWYCYLGRH